METNYSKGRYIGEIVTLFILEMIMLLFKLVQPLGWTAQVLPVQWAGFADELQYAAIELGLIVIIVCHFIFGRSFEEMGLKRFKENIGMFIGNLIFVAACVGITYFNSQLSKVLDFNGLETILTIAGDFIAVALVDEIIFRGFLMDSVEKALGEKGLVTGLAASVIVGIFFAATYIPQIIMGLVTFSGAAFMKALLYPFLLGVYLCVVYYFTKNLWGCIAVHGVVLSLGSLSADFFNAIFYGAYFCFMAVYLTVSIIKFYRQQPEEEQAGEAAQQVSKQENADNADEKPEEGTEEAVEEVTQLEKAEADLEEAGKPVDIPYFKEMMKEERSAEEDELDQTTMMPASEEADEEDLIISEADQIKTESSMDDTQVFSSPYIKEQEENIEEHSMEDTIVLPAADDNTISIPAVKEDVEDEERTMILPAAGRSKVIPFAVKGRTVPVPVEEEPKKPAARVRPEPNFIAHLEKYLGEFEGIFKQMTPTDPPIDIMFFKGERYNALVTNGMRGIPMKLPHELGDYKYLELMMFLDKNIEINDENIESEENAWLIKLLIDLSLFPKETGSYLSVGHIVGNGEKLEPYSKDSSYCGALIFPPMEQENVKFYRYVEKGNTVYIYNVMPLFKEELRFIQEHSSDQFINLMSEMGVRQIVKRDRINVIKAMNQEK